MYIIQFQSLTQRVAKKPHPLKHIILLCHLSKSASHRSVNSVLHITQLHTNTHSGAMYTLKCVHHRAFEPLKVLDGWVGKNNVELILSRINTLTTVIRLYYFSSIIDVSYLYVLL